MTAIDPDGVSALAARLGVSPHALLAIAARALARGDASIDHVWLDAEIELVRRAAVAVDNATEIALLGYAAYAYDDLDRGLALLWSGVTSERP
jgi:hypothetical protein